VTRMAPERASGPAWSPDGSRIAFTWSRLLTFADGKSAIYVVESDGSGVRRLTTYRNYDSFPGNVAWSPDGMTIAFTTSTSLDCTALELLELESGRTRPLTSCGGNALSAESPSWQPADAAGGR
jgi:Tol biopolymer transport system component